MSMTLYLSHPFNDKHHFGSDWQKYHSLNVKTSLKKIENIDPFEMNKKTTVAEKYEQYVIDKSRPFQQQNNLKNNSKKCGC